MSKNQGTSRLAHYHVLYDEIGFSVDDLQKLVHSLSYVYQRSTTAISIVAPIQYAHLAAAQIGQCMKNDNLSDASSSDGVTRAGGAPVPEIQLLHSGVFCGNDKQGKELDIKKSRTVFCSAEFSSNVESY